MALGRRNQRQRTLWIAAADLPQTAAHVFYRRLGELLSEHGFDEFAEQRCEKFSTARMGQSIFQSKDEPEIGPGGKGQATG